MKNPSSRGIHTLKIESGSTGRIKAVKVGFGPHYYLEIARGKAGALMLTLGATHHGFRADASTVGGNLERFIEELRRAHPEAAEDCGVPMT